MPTVTFVDIIYEQLLEKAAPVRKRVDRNQRRKRHVEYLKNKQKKKAKAKRYRKMTSYKKWKAKTKKKAVQGRTATGKRKKVYVG